MAGYSSWMAGNTVLAQEPHQFSRSWVDGSSETFHFEIGSGDSWFQFAIPTPTRIADKVASLERVMLLFRSESAEIVGIDRIDLWDGPNLIKTRSSVRWGGDHSAGIEFAIHADDSYDGNILPVEPHHQMSWGLNVSLHVVAGLGGDLTLISCGADFIANT